MHNGIYREFPFALCGYILGLTWEFVSSQANFIRRN